MFSTSFYIFKIIVYDGEKYDLFESLRASKAIPLAYNKKVKINGINYIDGSLSTPTSTLIQKAISQGAKNIILISNGDKISKITKLCWKTYSLFVNKKLKKSIKKYIEDDYTKIINENKNNKKINIFIIKPSRELKTYPLDNSKENVRDTFDLGIKDTKENKKLKEFIKKINLKLK